MPADGVGAALRPLGVLRRLVAREHVDEALLRGAPEEGWGVGPGDVGVELVGVELGEDEPVVVERIRDVIEEEEEGEEKKEVEGERGSESEREKIGIEEKKKRLEVGRGSLALSLPLFLSPSVSSFQCFTHIRLIPERKQLLTGMSTRVMLPVFVGESWKRERET